MLPEKKKKGGGLVFLNVLIHFYSHPFLIVCPPAF